MRISDWSSDVCSSDLLMAQDVVFEQNYVRNHSTLKSSGAQFPIFGFRDEGSMASQAIEDQRQRLDTSWAGHKTMSERFDAFRPLDAEARGSWVRSEEHTSELQSLMSISYAVFCSKKTKLLHIQLYN